jgi:uncharacterized damage-inducible protein DinB
MFLKRNVAAMRLANFLQLYDYTEWANDRVLNAVAELTDEQFTQIVGGSFPSLRETVAHLVVVEWVWLARWKGTSPGGGPAWMHADTLAPFRDALRAVEAERAEFLAGLTDDDLERPIRYTSLSGNSGENPLGVLMQHVANHSTFHRGQVVSMIRQVGGVPPASDFLDFVSR